jgi:hypothetical protein
MLIFDYNSERIKREHWQIYMIGEYKRVGWGYRPHITKEVESSLQMYK